MAETKKFKVLAGKHSQKVQTEDGGTQLVTFKKGDVIETDKPLDELFNGTTPATKKFELVDAGTRTSKGTVVAKYAPAQEGQRPRLAQQPQAQRQEARPQPTERQQQQPQQKQQAAPKRDAAKLQRMSVPELQALAADEEVDLKGAKTRDEMIKALLS